MVRWLRWHCPPAVWGRARYLSVTEAPHNTDFHTWMGKKHFCYFKSPRPGTEPRTLAWKAAVLTTTLGPPPNWLENQLLQGWAEREKSGPRSLGRDHQSGSRSLDRDHPGPRSHVSVLNSFRGYSNNFRKTFLNWLLHPLLIFFTAIFRPFTCGWRY